MTASTDLWEAQLDRELERIMKLTDEEIRAETIADGYDPDEVVARMHEIVNKVLAEAKRTP